MIFDQEDDLSDAYLDEVMADAAELARQVTARVEAMISAKFDEAFGIHQEGKKE